MTQVRIGKGGRREGRPKAEAGEAWYLLYCKSIKDDGRTGGLCRHAGGLCRLPSDFSEGPRDIARAMPPRLVTPMHYWIKNPNTVVKNMMLERETLVRCAQGSFQGARPVTQPTGSFVGPSAQAAHKTGTRRSEGDCQVTSIAKKSTNLLIQKVSTKPLILKRQADARGRRERLWP